MHLEAELHAALLKDVEDRVPHFRQEIEAGIDILLRRGRKRIEQMPDRRACKPVDDLDAELLCRPGRVFHLLGGTLAHAVGVAVPPDVLRQDRLMPVVDAVQHSLSDEVIGNREHLQIMFFQLFAFARTVTVVGKRLVDLEVVAPTSQLQAIVAPLTCLAGQVFQFQVGPLAGKQRDGSCHGGGPFGVSSQLSAVSDQLEGVSDQCLVFSFRINEASIFLISVTLGAS